MCKARKGEQCERSNDKKYKSLKSKKTEKAGSYIGLRAFNDVEGQPKCWPFVYNETSFRAK